MERLDKPFVVRAVHSHKEKNELKFKKGQFITVERINEEGTHYHGFYGKKEGWFPIHHAAIVEGFEPSTRKKEVANDADKKKLKEEKKKVEQEKREASVRAKREAKEALKDQRRQKTNPKGRPALTPGYFDRNDLPTHSLRRIPAVIEETVTFLERDEFLRTEGLFRISGSVSEVKAIKAAYLRGEAVDLTKVTDPHAVAGVLKLFFREARDPLLTYELYPCWLACMETGGVDHTQAIRRVIDLLPLINKLILYRLMGLLHKVTLYSDVNLMTPNNVAIVFAPNILRPPNENVSLALLDCATSNNLVRCMIEDYDLIFGEGTLKTAAPEPVPVMAALVTDAPVTEERPEDVLAPSLLTAYSTPSLVSEADFNKKIRMGSLLLAKGSVMGGQNSFEQLAQRASSDSEDDLDFVEVTEPEPVPQITTTAPSPALFNSAPSWTAKSTTSPAATKPALGGSSASTTKSANLLGASHRIDRCSSVESPAARAPSASAPPLPPPSVPAPAVPAVVAATEAETETSEDDSEEVDDEVSEPVPVKALRLEDLMEMIFDGKSAAVAAYLATLEPSVAALTQKNLLRSIDKVMQAIS